MTKYMLTVDYHGGVIDTPMTGWAPEEVKAHMDGYRAGAPSPDRDDTLILLFMFCIRL